MRDPPAQGLHRPARSPLPVRSAGHRGQAPPHQPHDEQGHHQDDLRGHQPRSRAGHPATDRRTDPRTLAGRGPAPRERPRTSGQTGRARNAPAGSAPSVPSARTPHGFAPGRLTRIRLLSSQEPGVRRDGPLAGVASMAPAAPGPTATRGRRAPGCSRTAQPPRAQCRWAALACCGRAQRQGSAGHGRACSVSGSRCRRVALVHSAASRRSRYGGVPVAGARYIPAGARCAWRIEAVRASHVMTISSCTVGV
jgi:hypothetical protein